MTRRRRTLFLLSTFVIVVTMGWAGSLPSMADGAAAASRGPVKPWGSGQLVDPQAGWLDEISCPSRAVCWMVDSYGNVVQRDHSRYSPPLRVVTPGDSSISCVAETCLVVGSRGHAARLLDGAWEPLSTPAGSVFHLVSCATADFCVALGKYGGRTFDGSSWGKRQTVDAKGELVGVSCASADFCVAGDSTGRLFMFDGTTWRPARDVSLAGVLSVSCPSPTYCMVLGTNKQLATYDAGRWQTSATPPE